MSSLEIFLAIALVQLLAAASPGPNLIVVSNHAASGSRSAALLSATGVLMATVTWTLLAIVGLGAVLLNYPEYYRIVQYAGAAYLVWLGARMVVAGVSNNYPKPEPFRQVRQRGGAIVLEGFLINMINPKTVAYYTSLFTALIPAQSEQWVFVAGAAVALSVSIAWWTAVALVFSTGVVKRLFAKTRRYIDIVTGGALILIGLRLASNR